MGVYMIARKNDCSNISINYPIDVLSESRNVVQLLESEHFVLTCKLGVSVLSPHSMRWSTDRYSLLTPTNVKTLGVMSLVCALMGGVFNLKILSFLSCTFSSIGDIEILRNVYVPLGLSPCFNIST